MFAFFASAAAALASSVPTPASPPQIFAWAPASSLALLLHSFSMPSLFLLLTLFFLFCLVSVVLILICGEISSIILFMNTTDSVIYLLSTRAESLYSLADTGFSRSSLISTSIPPTAILTSTRPVFASKLMTYYNKIMRLQAPAVSKVYKRICAENIRCYFNTWPYIP